MPTASQVTSRKLYRTSIRRLLQYHLPEHMTCPPMHSGKRVPKPQLALVHSLLTAEVILKLAGHGAYLEQAVPQEKMYRLQYCIHFRIKNPEVPGVCLFLMGFKM